MKKIIAALTALTVTAGLCSCSQNTAVNEQTSASENNAETVSAVQTAASVGEMFDEQDYQTDYSRYVSVALADGQSKADGAGVSVDGDTVTITAAGAYLLNGTLTDGQVVVNVKNKGKVQLILDNADITSNGSAAVYIKDAGEVAAIVRDGTSNRLASKGEYALTDDNIDAAVFSRSDITFAGSGSLEVTSESGHGIVSKDELKFTGGTYNVTSEKKALSANDMLCFDGGSYVLNSGADGIQCENTENAELGIVYAAKGDFEINSVGDCIDGSGNVIIEGGSYKLTSGGGSINAPEKAENFFGRFRGMDNTDTESTSDTVSCKAIKSASLVSVTGGSFEIDSADDALHSNGAINVSGGDFKIKAGDDAVHADNTLDMSSGTIKAECYEGLEASVLNIAGGEIDIIASDDGINAAGGNDSMHFDKFAGDADAGITISGGSIKIKADGDGLDSNGYLNVSGGNIYISGSYGTGNGAVDYQTTGTVSGGILAAAGDSGMSMNFDSSSTQCSVLHKFSSVHAQGEEIVLSDSSGNTVLSFAPENKYQSVVLTSPDIKLGEKYTITAGSESAEIEMTDTIVGEGGMMGHFGGMGGGRGGRFDERFSKEDFSGEVPELPQGERPDGMPEMPQGERHEGMPEMPQGERPDGMPEIPSQT
ncbi:MAG: carbohydrate-binding domain-containing protein [Oscillospiraceae bacterium]|nr:carbohydrate-binding domain-containing protein [Oscillospiraceae bacterium]